MLLLQRHNQNPVKQEVGDSYLFSQKDLHFRCLTVSWIRLLREKCRNTELFLVRIFLYFHAVASLLDQGK